MLTYWSIGNFKSLASPTTIAMAPLTILAHEKSAENEGLCENKSGLLQSIAILAQTLSVQGFHQPLMINGPFARGGKFSDIMCGPPSHKLYLRFEMDFQRDGQEVVDCYKSAHYKVSTSFIREKPLAHIEDIVVDTLALDFRCELDVPVSEGDSEVPEEEPAPQISEGQLQIGAFRSEEGKMVEEMLLEYPYMRVYRGRNALFLGTLDYTPSSRQNRVIKAQSRSEQFYVGLSSFLPYELIKREQGQIIGLRARRPVSLGRGMLDLEKAREQIAGYFSNKIYYLSAKRAVGEMDDLRYTPTSKLDEVGERGEFAVGVYHANEQTLVSYYDPITDELVQRPLQEALDQWMRYLDIAEKVRCEENEHQSSFSWKMYCHPEQKKFADADNYREFAQVVPLLLLGLLSPDGSLLLIERPEEQVREKGQFGMAKFLHGLIRMGKRCMLETASSILVDELKRIYKDLEGQFVIYDANIDKGLVRYVRQKQTKRVYHREKTEYYITMEERVQWMRNFYASKQ